MNFREMSGTAASMGDYGHSDVIKEECETALSLCVHCVCMLVQRKDFVDSRTLWLKLTSVFLFTTSISWWSSLFSFPTELFCVLVGLKKFGS